MCPRFDSWWHHTVREELLSRVAPLVVFAISQQAEQSTGIIYKLALCPRFDSWWHHTAQEELLSRVLLLLFSPYIGQCAALPIAAHCIRHRSVLRSSMQRAAYFRGLCSLGDACSPASCYQAAKRAMRAWLGEISVVQACLYQYFSLTLWAC